MSELSISSFIAIFEEMFGVALFWGLVAVAAIVLISFIYVVIKHRGVRSAAFVRGELIGLLGGFAAVWFVLRVTESSLYDIGGAVDVMLIALIWVAGAIGTAIGAYVVQGLIRSRAPEE